MKFLLILTIKIHSIMQEAFPLGHLTRAMGMGIRKALAYFSRNESKFQVVYHFEKPNTDFLL